MIRKIWLFLIIVVNIFACTRKQTDSFSIKVTDLINKDVDIIETRKISGFPIGCNFNTNDIYIRLSQFNDDTHTIGIFNISTGKIEHTFSRPKGGFQSPGDFFNPTYMEYLDEQYYVVDWFFKILVFNSNNDYLYTKMFKDSKQRYFFDFFKRKEEYFFLIGEKKYRPETARCLVNIYKIDENKGIEIENQLFKIDLKEYFNLETKNPLLGTLWASNWGFEKDGNIYIGSSSEKQFHFYNIDQNRLTSVQLEYLQGKKFNNSNARRIRYDIYKTGDELENMEKKLNKKFTDVAYPDKIYYFSFLNIGENKIGIVGDIDLTNMIFRLDIIENNSFKYIKSIYLPFGEGFLRQLYSRTRGLFLNWIDIDKGLYIWIEKGEGEDPDQFFNLTHFKIK